MRRLSWLFIETPARAAGFLSVLAILTILALRFEFGHSWNLYAAGGQVVKAGEATRCCFRPPGRHIRRRAANLSFLSEDRPFVELTADDTLLSKELTSRCGRDIQFVNLGFEQPDIFRELGHRCAGTR